jgi:hypothetical protein
MPLPRVKVGDIIRADHIQQICAEIEQNRIRQGPGIRTSVTSSGTTVSTDNVVRWGASSQSGGGVGNNWATPFSVISGYPLEGMPRLRVHGESYLSIIETGGLLDITGLGAIPGSGSDNVDDPGQFDIPAIGDSIWIESTVSGFNITSSSIWTGKAGVDGWSNYPDPIKVETITPEEGSPYQAVTATRALIAHIVAADDPRQGDIYTVPGAQPEDQSENRKVLQRLTTNLGVQVLVMKGIACPVLVPWHGPFVIE